MLWVALENGRTHAYRLIVISHWILHFKVVWVGTDIMKPV